jgi:hypothetical protein
MLRASVDVTEARKQDTFERSGGGDRSRLRTLNDGCKPRGSRPWLSVSGLAPLFHNIQYIFFPQGSTYSLAQQIIRYFVIAELICLP